MSPSEARDRLATLFTEGGRAALQRLADEDRLGVIDQVIVDDLRANLREAINRIGDEDAVEMAELDDETLLALMRERFEADLRAHAATTRPS